MVGVMRRGRVEARVGCMVLAVTILSRPRAAVPGRRRLVGVRQALIGRELIARRRKRSVSVVRVPAGWGLCPVVVVVVGVVVMRRGEVFVQMRVRRAPGSRGRQAASQRGTGWVRGGLREGVVVARATGTRRQGLVLEVRR